MEQPDPLKHQNISFMKSGLRIFASLYLIFGNIVVAGLLLIIAEVFGIIEEIV